MNTTNQNDKISHGNDIEMQIFDIKKNKIVSALSVLKTDKYAPIELGQGIKLYADGVMAETSFPPYFSKEEMIERFSTVFSLIQEYIGSGYRLVCKAAHVYDVKELQDPRENESGCNANYNAYEECINERPEFGNNGLRSAGLHWHFGGNNNKFLDFKTRINTIKLMDLYLGVPSVLLTEEDDSEILRRNLFGKSSEHRPTAFGGEYRVTSPSLLNSREKTELAFDLMNYAFKQVQENKEEEVLKSVDVRMVRTAIDKCDIRVAKNVLKKIKLPKDLMSRINKKYKADFYESWKIKV